MNINDLEAAHISDVQAGDRVLLPNVIVGDSVHGWVGPVVVTRALHTLDVKHRPYAVLTHDHPDLGVGVWLVGGTAMSGARATVRRFPAEAVAAP